jgi:hypothetical protein
VNRWYKKKNDQKMVREVQTKIAKVYNGFPYSPDHAFVDRAVGRFMLTLSATQIHQRRNLKNVIQTITKMFARYSQRPGTGGPEQEWVLLQLTDINGVGGKDPKNHRSKTAVNAYGRKEGITKYNKQLVDQYKGGR